MSVSIKSKTDFEQYVRDLLECPVCTEIITSVPIFQCANGHVTCVKCIPKVEWCPICRNVSTPIRNLKLEEIVQKLDGFQSDSNEVLKYLEWSKGSAKLCCANDGLIQTYSIQLPKIFSSKIVNIQYDIHESNNSGSTENASNVGFNKNIKITLPKRSLMRSIEITDVLDINIEIPELSEGSVSDSNESVVVHDEIDNPSISDLINQSDSYEGIEENAITSIPRIPLELMPSLTPWDQIPNTIENIENVSTSTPRTPRIPMTSWIQTTPRNPIPLEWSSDEDFDENNNVENFRQPIPFSLLNNYEDIGSENEDADNENDIDDNSDDNEEYSNDNENNDDFDDSESVQNGDNDDDNEESSNDNENNDDFGDSGSNQNSDDHVETEIYNEDTEDGNEETYDIMKMTMVIIQIILILLVNSVRMDSVLDDGCQILSFLERKE